MSSIDSKQENPKKQQPYFGKAVPLRSHPIPTHAWLFCYAIASTAIVGCSHEASIRRYPLTGNVTHEGKSVDEGTISFLPSSSGGLPASTLIQGGEYSFTAANGPCAGPNRVVIGLSITRPGDAAPGTTNATTPAHAKQAPGASTSPSSVERIAKARLQWELEYVVPPEGAERKDFDLRE